MDNLKKIPYGTFFFFFFLKYPNKLVLGETALFQQCAEQMVDYG